jgi:hypothetical protein
MDHRHSDGALWSIDEPAGSRVNPSVARGGTERIGEAGIVKLPGAKSLAATRVSCRLEREAGKHGRLVKQVDARLVISGQSTTPLATGGHRAPQQLCGSSTHAAPRAGSGIRAENGSAGLFAALARWQAEPSCHEQHAPEHAHSG